MAFHVRGRTDHPAGLQRSPKTMAGRASSAIHPAKSQSIRDAEGSVNRALATNRTNGILHQERQDFARPSMWIRAAALDPSTSPADTFSISPFSRS